MTGHIRGHHHLNYQGPKFPFGGHPWRKKDENKWKVKISSVFATSNQNQVISYDISNLT